MRTSRGGAGDDSLIGDEGTNILNGAKGDDILQGSSGADRLIGGAGADDFIFAYLEHSTRAQPDTIVDFNRDEGDKIILWGIDANENVRGFQNFTFATDGILGMSDVVYRAGRLLADVTGDGEADLIIRVLGGPVGAADLFL